MKIKGGRFLSQKPIAFSQLFFNCSSSKRKRGSECKIVFTELFVSFLSENFSRKISYFNATASGSLYILTLSQLIKLSPNEILTKMLFLSLVYRNYDIVCKYVPKTKNE